MTDDHWPGMFESASMKEELQAALFRVSQDLGCSTFAAMWLHEESALPVTDTFLHNVPQAYFDSIEKNPQKWHGDPGVKYLTNSNLPLAWDRSFYEQHNASSIWQEHADLGSRSGVCTTLVMPKKRRLLIAMERDSDSMGSASEQEYLKRSMLLAALYAQDALDRIAPDISQLAVKLSSREIECLRWTMEGKTAWEISRILSISERTVVQYIQSAVAALGAANKTHAVMKALKLHLIP